MITLHLGIGSGDIEDIEFLNPSELMDYLIEIEKMFSNRVWLFCDEDEIFISEKFDTIFVHLKEDWSLDVCDYDKEVADTEYHLHEYESYKDAYLVAFDMREGNPLCFNKK